MDIENIVAWGVWIALVLSPMALVVYVWHRRYVYRRIEASRRICLRYPKYAEARVLFEDYAHLMMQELGEKSIEFCYSMD